MSRIFRHAIVKPPSATFADGLTTAGLGRPSYGLALEQHRRYCEALSARGVAIHPLLPDPGHPDSTFVEDTAVITARGAIVTRPGAASRVGEVRAVRDALGAFFPRLGSIEPPGTLDGGDTCEVGGHVLIGISSRTNEAGAEQLGRWLLDGGITSSLVDIRGIPRLLHLRAGLAWLGGRGLAVAASLDADPALSGYERIVVPDGEAYAANCILVNGGVLLPSGHPGFERSLREAGFDVEAIDMSEFEKMDGGLSCLSLRF